MEQGKKVRFNVRNVNALREIQIFQPLVATVLSGIKDTLVFHKERHRYCYPFWCKDSC
jgi:hypothetical protein